MKNATRTLTLGIMGIGIMLFSIACLFQSCDACSKKPGTVNVDVKDSGKAGSASISLTDLNKSVSSSNKEYLAVSFNGTLIAEGEGTGQTSFTTQKTYEVTNTNVSPVPTVTRVNLKPGTWTITVSAKTWTTSCSKVITSGTATSFSFVYNQSNCN